MGEKIFNKGGEKHWLHMEEVQFEAANSDWKTRNCFIAPQVFDANEKTPRGREIF
jgi:hypothetical protein